MTQSQIKNIFFVLLSCLLFFLELILFAVMQQYEIYLLLCFFIALIVQQPQHRTLVAPLCLMSMMSYLEMNIFGWCLVYIMPTMMLANYLDQHLRIKVIIPYLLITAALCIKMSLGWYMHGITVSCMHATQILTYNTIVIALFLSIGAYLETKFENYLSKRIQ